MRRQVHSPIKEGTALNHMRDHLSSLPLELTLMVLAHLDISSLLSFGATSHANYIYHTLCLKRLHLAVFQRRLHTTIAFIEAGSSNLRDSGRWDPRADYHIPILLPRSNRGKDVVGHRSPLRGPRYSIEARRRAWGRDEESRLSAYQTIRAQNDVFAALLNRYGGALHDLEFMAYDIDTKGAVALASNCKWKLRRLALRFEHPHIRDAMLPRNYWLEPASGSTAWNALIGIGEYKKDMGLTGLESLVLERAGITAWQLRMLVKRNPRLRELRLRTCKAIQPEFLNWLGGIEKDPDEEGAPGAALQTLWLENCDDIFSERIDANDQVVGLEWVAGMKNLTSLSFRDCRRIQPDLIEKANKTIWHIPEVFLPLPLGAIGPGDGMIEVDPAYM